MRPRLLLCVALYLLGAGHVGAMVVQNPRYLVTGLGKPVTLSCSQNMKHDAMYWYQQKPSQAPKLLLYYYDKQITKEKNTSENFQSSRPNTSFCSLDIRSAGLGDSAVYLCASSRDTELKPSLPSVHKPLFPRAKSPLYTCLPSGNHERKWFKAVIISSVDRSWI